MTDRNGHFDVHVGPTNEAEIERILADVEFDDINAPTPPESIWDSIADVVNNESGLADSVSNGVGLAEHTPLQAPAAGAIVDIDRLDDDHGDFDPPQPVQARAHRLDASRAPQGDGDDDRGKAPVTPLPTHGGGHRRPGSRRWWVGAAAAIVAAAAGVGLWTARESSDTVVAQAALIHEDGFDPIGADATATAQLVGSDGKYEIVLNDADLPSDTGPDSDLEIWLIEARDDGSLDVQPVSLLAGGENRVEVPADLDPTTHNIVDISIEPRDGDPQHSGRSILRGVLDAV